MFRHFNSLLCFAWKKGTLKLLLFGTIRVRDQVLGNPSNQLLTLLLAALVPPADYPVVVLLLARHDYYCIGVLVAISTIRGEFSISATTMLDVVVVVAPQDRYKDSKYKEADLWFLCFSSSRRASCLSLGWGGGSFLHAYTHTSMEQKERFAPKGEDPLTLLSYR
jgi:hypothetical protein